MAKANSNGHAPIPAVCYLRMSSDKQEASIGEQREAVYAYAAKHGYVIIAEYIDEGISGDNTAKRLQFQLMIADAATGRFKAVLCWDQDRFGRFDSIEAGRWIHPLREAGVCLDTVAQGRVDWSDFAGRMVYGIQQEGKHAFLRDLSRNTLRGQLATAKRGGWMSRVPHGYRTEGDKGNKRLLIDDTAAGTVRRIFADYLTGHSLRSIALRLNADCIPSPANRGWNVVSIHNVLHNVAYVGTYRWNAKHEGKYNGVAGDCVASDVAKGLNDSGEWIVFEDHHPPLIDKQTFATVQTRLTERKRITTPIKSGGNFLLTGLLRCGKCGGVMRGRQEHGERYSCADFHHKGICDRNSVAQSVLLPAVADAIRDKLLTGNAIDRLKEAIRRKLTTSTPKVDAAKIGKQLADVAGKIERARRRLIEVDSDMLGDVQQHLRGLREQQETLEAALKHASTPVQRRRDEIGDSVDSIFAGVFRLEKLLQDGESTAVREALRTAVSRVDVWADKVREGNRDRYRLQRGVIHFAATEGNNLLSKRWLS